MSVVIILLIASVLVAGGFLAAFLWAVRNGQYDDLETPAARILFDDAEIIPDKKSTSFPKE
jgi:cbb3-type cytochrome oxidase maturation protein